MNRRGAPLSTALILAICFCSCGSGGAPSAPAGAAPFIEPNGDNSIPTFGTEASAAKRRRAEAALRAYLTARAAGEWTSACAALAASLKDQLERFASGSTCPTIYRELSEPNAAFSQRDSLRGPLVALRTKDGSGFALFYGPDEQKYMMPMVWEAGDWKAAQLAPVPYPSGQLGTP